MEALTAGGAGASVADGDVAFFLGVAFDSVDGFFVYGSGFFESLLKLVNFFSMFLFLLGYIVL